MLTTLLHIADSSFPSGAFAHSHGLEYAIENKWVNNYVDLDAWCREALKENLLPFEAVACTNAWHLTSRGAPSTESISSVAERLGELSIEVASFRPTQESRDAGEQMGRSFLSACGQVYNDDFLQELSQLSLQHTIAWGVACQRLGIPLTETWQTLVLSIIRQWAQVAVRIIPLGQVEANKLIANATRWIAQPRAPEPGEPLQSAAFGLEVAALGHENMTARYFRS